MQVISPNKNQISAITEANGLQRKMSKFMPVKDFYQEVEEQLNEKFNKTKGEEKELFRYRNLTVAQ